MTLPPWSNRPHTIKCAHCHRTHNNSAAVRACSRGQRPTTTAYQSTTQAPPVWPLRTPRAMVELIKDGRYAVRPDSNSAFTFVRVKHPKTGKKKGCLVLQTQHSDWYRDELTIWPSGSIYCPKPNQIDMPILLVAADPMTSAINYGRELGVCSRCGRELTDERSRWYSCGPECEKYWPEIFAWHDEQYGPWFLGKVRDES